MGTAATLAFAAYAWRALAVVDMSRYASPSGVAGIGAAALIYCLALPLAAVAWSWLLVGLGTPVSASRLAAILAVSQLGKYLPGNVGHFVGRAGLGLHAGIGPAPLMAGIVIETVLTVLAGITLGGLAIALSDALVLTSAAPLRVITAGAALAIGALLLTARTWVPRLLGRVPRQVSEAVRATDLPSPLVISLAFCAYLAIYVVLGIALVVLAHALVPAADHDGALLIGSFALAWLAGFATPGAPAGLGVREATLLLLLGNAYSAADATVIIVGLRLATLAGDSLCAAAGAAWFARSRVPIPSRVSKP